MTTPAQDEDLRQAADVRTAPARLAALATHADTRVRRLVASNPSAPLAALSALIAEFGREVDGNAALLLHRMACPTWLPTLPKEQRRLVMQQRPLLLWLVAPMIEHEEEGEVLMALADNPDCPAELYGPLGVHRYIFVIQGLVQQAVAPALLACFATHPERLLRIALAGNPRCPPEAIERLLGDAERIVRATAMVHPSRLDGPAAAVLVRSFRKRERVSMASDHECPPALFAALADDPEFDVRGQVVIHNRCSADAMERLARDDDPEIRRLLAAHRKCPAHLFERLSRDPDSLVRQSVARGVSCPLDVRVALVRDADPQVQQAALAQPDGFLQLADRLLASEADRALWPLVRQHRNASVLTAPRR